MANVHPPRARTRALLRAGWPLRLLVAATACALMVAPVAGRAGRPAEQPIGKTQAVVDTTTPNPAHPFSAPVWSPLREPAVVACVYSNCTSPEYHGYWAIDFDAPTTDGNQNPEVHPTGAGIFHIGAQDRSCPTSGQGAGVWGWVDHGGGTVTKYTHLDRLAAAEGQLVTPATVIGYMGHWGDTAPCTTNYLHYEVREGGITGTRVALGSLKACTTSGTVSMPGIFGGAKSFNDLKPQVWSTPLSTSSCVTDDWNRTPARPTLSAVRHPGTAGLTWGTPPAGTTAVRVLVELWSPSLNRWGFVGYYTYAGTLSNVRMSGLTLGRKYRMSVAFRNAYGYSAWSPSQEIIPATVPSAPQAPRFLTSPTTDYIHYGWWKSRDNGAAVTSYTAQVSCYSGGVYHAWSSHSIAPTTYYYNFRGLGQYTLCKVRVRAANALGSSYWSTTSSIRKAHA